jgi:hypothetical protein
VVSVCKLCVGVVSVCKLCEGVVSVYKLFVCVVDRHEEEIMLTDDNKSEEDELETIEAIAEHDFNARSPREVSFKKGQTLKLYGRVSTHWWKGRVLGGGGSPAIIAEGLIPDQYISKVGGAKLLMG